MEMEPAQKHYLIVYLAIVIPVALSFLFMRKGSKDPVRLRMKDGDPNSGGRTGAPHPQTGVPPLDGIRAPNDGPKQEQSFRPAGSGNPDASQEPYPRPRAAQNAPAREKSLNVLFNWNGHSWDAYEVLGLPAGSSFDAAKNAYARAMYEASEDGKPFIRAAFDAIAKTV